jgi:hypothetical protein
MPHLLTPATHMRMCLQERRILRKQNLVCVPCVVVQPSQEGPWYFAPHVDLAVDTAIMCKFKPHVKIKIKDLSTDPAAGSHAQVYRCSVRECEASDPRICCTRCLRTHVLH